MKFFTSIDLIRMSNLARWKYEQIRICDFVIFVPKQPKDKPKLNLWNSMLRSARRAAKGGVVSPLGVVVPPCPTANTKTALYREWHRWYALAWRKLKAPRFKLVKRRPWELKYSGINHKPKKHLLHVYSLKACGYSVRLVGDELGLSTSTVHSLIERARIESKRPVYHKLMQLQKRLHQRMEAA